MAGLGFQKVEVVKRDKKSFKYSQIRQTARFLWMGFLNHLTSHNGSILETRRRGILLHGQVRESVTIHHSSKEIHRAIGNCIKPPICEMNVSFTTRVHFSGQFKLKSKHQIGCSHPELVKEALLTI
jgi:hypothetical protein